MSVRKDDQRKTWFFVVDLATTDGTRRQVKRRGFATRKEAAHAERAVLDEQDVGAVPPARLTFGKYLTDRWLPAVDVDTRLKPTTRANYRSFSKHLVVHVGAVPLGELTGEHLDLVQRQLAGRSDSLRHNVHVTASKALRQAVRWKLLTASPVADAAPPPQAIATPTGWTPVEMARFLAEAVEDRWWPLWRLVAVTGMRRGEVVGLTWANLDLERGELLVDRAVTVVGHEVHETTTKTQRARSLAIDAETVAVLRSWRAVQSQEMLLLGKYRPTHDSVFTWPDGSRVHPSVVTRTFGRIAARAELPPLRLHGLRHSWANAALDAGVDIVDVSKRLGHSSIRVTADVYTPASSSRDRAAGDAVAGLYDQRPRPPRGHTVVTESR